MVVLIILSILCIASYTAAVCVKNNGIPYSISETFYKLEHKAWFGISMLLTAALLMPAILDATPPSYQFTAFLACIGMMLIGIAPNFQSGIERPVHITGAVLCILFSQVWVGLIFPWMLLLWAVYLAYTIWATKIHWKGNLISAFLLTKPMFWIEVTALLATYVTLFILL